MEKNFKILPETFIHFVKMSDNKISVSFGVYDRAKLLAGKSMHEASVIKGRAFLDESELAGFRSWVNPLLIKYKGKVIAPMAEERPNTKSDIINPKSSSL